MKPLRIALINLAQETNSFNPVLTSLADFEAFGIHEGEAVVSRCAPTSEVGGYLAAVGEWPGEVKTVPIIRGWAVAGGPISREVFDLFAQKIREGLAAAGPVDGLELQLHGACVAEMLDDVEGEQVELCRQILGDDVPIMLALDHHANVTEKMVKNATAILAHRTQPHDVYDTGLQSTRLLLRTAAGEVSPAMASRKVPLISHQEQFLTAKGPMKVLFDRAREMEGRPVVLSASPCPMQPWLDVEEGGWTMIVVTDGDQALAEDLAEELADLAWSMRADFQEREAVSVDDAVRRAHAAPKGVVLLSDTGDTVFGGAAGDSNVILEAVLRLGVEGPVLIPLISPALAARLAEAGEGATVTVKVGGDSAPAFFDPIEVTGRVAKVADGSRVSVGYNHQSEVDMGTVAVFEVGPAVLLVSEKRGVAGNLPDAYSAFGIDPAKAKMAILKTASNFQYFMPLASELIRADTRGPGQSDLATLPWRRLPRPIYPLDPMDDWRASSQRRS